MARCMGSFQPEVADGRAGPPEPSPPGCPKPGARFPADLVIGASSLSPILGPLKNREVTPYGNTQRRFGIFAIALAMAMAEFIVEVTPNPTMLRCAGADANVRSADGFVSIRFWPLCKALT